ncbi:alpha/beta hydrolase [Hymenobacter oligotrophus]|uniref:Alpha/beta hydrolase n=1 Tax=Hymenobacter oligotrophus TaxID=2319843 RepID=A0A3B7R9U5_9BACT|nr:alpha/beta hydrolase [Hymenobacter oligotrophus]AYA37841.1 alpha/beta hydrolase [Hymenobacter oligotrophus]
MSDFAASQQPALYLIPGLGADERIFQRLLPQLRGHAKVLNWIPPTHPDEPLSAYAERMAEGIPLDQRCWLVGVSFGGTVALEIARLRPLALVALISSIPGADQLPPLLRVIRATGVQHWVPPQLLKLFPRAGKWYFGIGGGSEYQLFKEVLRDQEPRYTRWAIRSLLRWDSRDIGPCVQIRGTRDRVFPAGPAKVEYLIEGGTHFMVYSRADEVARILNELTAEFTAEPPVVNT